MTQRADNPLDLLFSAYFHQDWTIDANSADGILDAFVAHESVDVVRKARDEARDLVESDADESELERVLTERELGYDPAFDGWSNREWLQHVVERLSNRTDDASMQP